jgi:hypothetical protein
VRAFLLIAGACVASTLVVAWLARGAFKRPAVDGCGEAPSTAGETSAGEMSADGGQPRGGGVVPAPTSAGWPCSPRSSVPAHEQLLNYRLARENRFWVNDFALAGALDQWSREVPS